MDEVAYCGDESYAEDVPSETYEPTYLRPKDQMPSDDEESEGTYEELEMP